MSDVFETHFNDASTCDITVKAGAIKIHAHKIVLIAQSALFRAMFQYRKLYVMLAADAMIACA